VTQDEVTAMAEAAGSGAAIRILVADDHPMTREGIALILGNQPDMVVVAEAADGQEAVELYAMHRPDIALLDLQMPRLGGVGATEAILAAHPGGRVVLFTTYDGDDDIYRGLRAGAKAYLLKDSPRQEVCRALRAVHAGERYLPPLVGAKLAQRMEYDTLTARELDVLRLVAAGHANKEIGFRLGVSEGTVKSHLNGAMGKLGVTSRTEAVIVAGQRGLLRR